MALDALGIAEGDYGRVVMVGNNLERDMVGANRLGLISIFFHWNDRRRNQPLDDDEHPQYTVSSANELIGADPLDRERIWQNFWRNLRTSNLGLPSGQWGALWGLFGKVSNQPVHKLLGGCEIVPQHALARWRGTRCWVLPERRIQSPSLSTTPTIAT